MKTPEQYKQTLLGLIQFRTGERLPVNPSLDDKIAKLHKYGFSIDYAYAILIRRSRDLY